jgi:hypothetical protein
MNGLLAGLGRRLATYLSARSHVCSAGRPSRPEELLAALRPGDVLLVEGQTRVSTAIKFLTQSTWSHAALYVGPYLARDDGPDDHCFIEADIKEGVRSTTVDEYAGLNTRICRPVGLSEQECLAVVDYAASRLGHQYDLRHVFDLARYLLPTPPVPTRFRRRMIALGSGDPTRAICSTLIALAFQSIRYPILPDVEFQDTDAPNCPGCFEEILHLRHHTLFVPRDFDVSPYFEVVKPTLAGNFDFRSLRWSDAAAPRAA